LLAEVEKLNLRSPSEAAQIVRLMRDERHGHQVPGACALLAILFSEPERAAVARRLEGARLVAPSLLRFEIVNVCLTKIRRHSAIRESIVAAFSLQAEFAVEAAEWTMPEPSLLLRIPGEPVMTRAICGWRGS
jgi:hypothetical protein